MYRAYWRRLVWPAEILLQETIHVVLSQLCCSLRTSSFLFLYILADLISFLEIQRLQLAGSSSTVFAVNLILTFLNFSSSGLIRGGGGGGREGGGGRIDSRARAKVLKRKKEFFRRWESDSNENIKTAIGWFKTEDNWVRVHVFLV